VKMFTEAEVEAALCAWEYMLERPGPWDAYLNHHGAAASRWSSINTGVWIEAVSNRILFDTPFDWEIVPWLMQQLDLTDNTITYPDIPTTRAALLVAFPESEDLMT
jgi:hypothetical protein